MIRLHKAVFLLSTIVLLFTLSLMGCKISARSDTDLIVDDDGVADFDSVQEAINSASPGDTILVRAGIYYENVVVDKRVSLVGEERGSTVINGDGTGAVILISANNVSITGFTIEGSGTHAKGILVDNSIGNIIINNRITNNYHGVGFYSSLNNVVSGNSISGNELGIILLDSNNYRFFHNNLLKNAEQVYSYNSHGLWDNGVEGNYWISYKGADMNRDGIGDIPHSINQDNEDPHPLMGMYSDFHVSSEGEDYPFTTICNSTISGFRFRLGSETGNKIVRFNVTGKDGTTGFCRVSIPTGLMDYPDIMLVDGEEVVPYRLAISNETYTILYFTYLHTSKTITIISSITLHLYNQLLERHVELQNELQGLNTTYSMRMNDLMKNYSLLLGDYSKLQADIVGLNSSYQEHLADYSQNVYNIRSVMYMFAATTGIFITTTVYLSKRAHETE